MNLLKLITMKRILLFTLTIGTLIASAQTFVSTTPENKNVILEEFTGISCGFCPDGHLIAKQIHDANPNDVAIIAIHAGGFANPQGPGTDFRTTEGTAIDSYWAISGYPSGTVNRDGGAMGRSMWAGAASQILTQSSPVNVAAQATVDMATNTLTVDVEVYYTAAQSVNTNMLHVAVLQNNVEGPQSGSSGNPTQVLPNGNYNHQHMLRHLMTGTWGELIGNLTPQSCYSNQYMWNMPADINGVILDPTNITVVAFVSEDNETILNGTTEISPNVVFQNSYDAYCMSTAASNIVCAPTTDIEVTFRNYGNIPLVSLDIEYSINGGASNIYPWTGNLASAGTETVLIPGIALTPSLTNTVDITLLNPNGLTDQNPANNMSSGSFAGLTSATPGNATIDVTTDAYANEISWELKDDNGTIIASSGGTLTTNNAAQPTVNAALSTNTCYSFTIYDSYGDGILAPGGYTVKDGAGNVIASMALLGSYTSEQRTNFETNSTIPASWDCDGQGNCADPGTGTGQYSSLTACQAACISTSINEEKNSSLSIYPNPAKDILNIDGVYNSITISNIHGQTVLVTNSKKEVNISSLQQGIYLITIESNDKKIMKKLTISK